MTEEYQGYTIHIEQDADAESPREWDNLGTMVCWHPRYSLGDKQVKREDAQDAINAIPSGSIVQSIYLYEHGGLSMHWNGNVYPFCDLWDAGIGGIIYVAPDKIRNEYSRKRISRKLRAKVRKVLRSEIEVYHQYLSGQVYGYIVTDAEGNVDDSLWGCYGYDYCLEQAKEHIDYLVGKESQS